MQQKGSFSMQASTNRNPENSERRRCVLSAGKGVMGVHSAGNRLYWVVFWTFLFTACTCAFHLNVVTRVLCVKSCYVLDCLSVLSKFIDVCEADNVIMVSC